MILSMNKEEIVKGRYSKYEQKADGLYCNGEIISCITPEVAKVEEYYAIDSRKIKRIYWIKIIYPNGDETEAVELSSLEKLSIFEHFRFPDVNISGKARKLIKEKLQLEASLMMVEKYFFCRQGLQIFNGKPIYVLGDKIVGNELMEEKFKTDFPYKVPDIDAIDIQNVVKQSDNPINFMPGVSVIIFYYSLQAIVKPILHEIGIESNYTLAVIGPSGHLKTSMVKKMALWLQAKEKQQVNFSSSTRTAKILANIDMFAGMNYP